MLSGWSSRSELAGLVGEIRLVCAYLNNVGSEGGSGRISGSLLGAVGAKRDATFQGGLGVMEMVRRLGALWPGSLSVV